jgi:enterochelin esterase-like enzyme
MITRQAILFATCLSFLAGLSSCAPSVEITSTQAPTPTVVAGVPSPTSPPAAPTPLICLTEPGSLQQGVVATTNPPQEFIIYLPPCYKNFANARYPTLYLLHGQTYFQDQWARLRAPEVADQLIHVGEAPPFIMVFPDDRYWNTPAGSGFGMRFINDLIPYVDANYRTVADREHRSLGGLSRGGGWVAQLGFAHPELFGALGFHSPAIFKDNSPYLGRIIQAIPNEMRPQVWLDIGDADQELGHGVLFEEILRNNDYIHEFHRFSGDHSELYWGAHVNQYLRWYTQFWRNNSVKP